MKRMMKHLGLATAILAGAFGAVAANGANGGLGDN